MSDRKVPSFANLIFFFNGHRPTSDHPTIPVGSTILRRLHIDLNNFGAKSGVPGRYADLSGPVREGPDPDCAQLSALHERERVVTDNDSRAGLSGKGSFRSESIDHLERQAGW